MLGSGFDIQFIKKHIEKWFALELLGHLRPVPLGKLLSLTPVSRLDSMEEEVRKRAVRPRRATMAGLYSAIARTPWGGGNE